MSNDIPARAKEVRLAKRPGWGEPVTPDTLVTVDVEVPRPGDGQVLVRNDWMLLAMAMRDLIAIDSSHPDLPMPIYEIGQPPWALTVGTVVESKVPDLAPGDLVTHTMGWREYAMSDLMGAWGPAFTKQDRSLFPGSNYFLTQGPTAWRGMVEVAKVGEGDTVFVSGAGGGVGSLAGQIAKCQGAKRVIGTAGSKEKVEYLLDELGYDAAFNYHDGPVADKLSELAPEGVDVFFDNVGGEQFEAALKAAAWNARFALCGSLSGKNPVLDYEPAVLKDITIRGFTTPYGPEDTAKWNQAFSGWVRDGKFNFKQTVFEGAERSCEALISLIEGKTRGTVLVKLS